jgi:hypothetical protein
MESQMGKTKEAETEVLSEGGAVAKISEQASVKPLTEAQPLDLGQFAVKKVITRPVLKLVVDKPVAFRVDTPLEVGKVVEGDKKPADVFFVTNIVNGQECTVVVPAVLKAELEENYPDNSYVGKYFGIVKREKVEGKRYHNYDIVELDESQFEN